jgi:hypothetical protein
MKNQRWFYQTFRVNHIKWGIRDHGLTRTQVA